MQFTLDNGLTVLLHQNRAAPVVAFQAWVAAGSADETDAEAGLAHVHEHMLFKGTARRGVGEIAQAVEAAGGDINAWTSFDETVYHLVLASRHFGVGLDILSDALRHSAFDPEELAREREVILEEMRRAYDMPSRRASRETFGLAFERHPYRRPVIGFEETVSNFSRDDILAFYRKHYRPEQVALLLVGDFELDAARGEVERYFGDWAGSERGEQPGRPAEPPQSGLRSSVVHDKVQEAYLDLAWHIPAAVEDDVAALDLLSVILGQGESSRLVKRLVRDLQVANDAGAYAYTPRDPGLLFARAQAPSERPREALAEMLACCYALHEAPPSDAELAKAKRIVLAESVYQQETVQGQARRMGFFHTVCGSTAFEARYHQRIADVSPAEVQRVAQAYLRPEGLTSVALVDEESDFDAAALQEICHEAARKARPAPRPRKRGGEMERIELASGLTLLVQEDPAVPLAAVRGVFVGGLRYETPENNGIETLMARTLTSGTADLDAEAIAEQVDSWAATLTGVSGRNSFGLVGEFLRPDLEAGLALYARCLQGATFPQEEVDKERTLQLEEIRAREDNPAGVAFDLFQETLYQEHPYRMDVRGSAETLAKLDSAALRGRLTELYPTSRLTLAVVGDVQRDEIVERCEALFQGGQAAVALPTVAVEPEPEAPRVVTRALDKAQAHVVIGYPGLKLDDDDRFALDVLNSVLSGQGGRLFMELRDKRSLAYSVTSMGVEGIDPGFFAVYIGTSPDKVEEAVSGIRAELEKVCQQAPEASELERARRYLVGSHDIGLQRASARAALAAFDEAYGLGFDAHQRYAAGIEAVDADKVVAVARRLIVPGREVLTVVGPEGCAAPFLG
ncbi:MAG: pitrilysin family protein [Deltaproteobacteria bacterium]|nr:pitrilysin family protein [Deltaproteobacteria bacterium]